MSIGTCPSYTLCVRWSREAVRDGSSSGSGFCRLQHRFQTLSSHNTCKMPDSGFAQTVRRWEDKLTVRKACQSCNFWKALGWRGKELALIKMVKLSLRNLVKSHLSKAGPSWLGKVWADLAHVRFLFILIKWRHPKGNRQIIKKHKQKIVEIVKSVK